MCCGPSRICYLGHFKRLCSGGGGGDDDDDDDEDRKRKDVGTECRHDMRPSFQFRVARAPTATISLNWFSLNIAKPNLPPELLAFRHPKVNDARLLWRFLTSGDLDL